MNSATHHTPVQSFLAGKWPGMQQNGIIRSFVASRKKYLFCKRAFDIVFSSLVILCILSWFAPLIALLIKLDSRGPVFFRQKRIGKNGMLFQCLKFRTMILNEEADERPADENDERVTRVGRWLRKTNMDELPQFYNVLKGEMSVVGPRPHMVADCIRFSFVISSYSFRSLLRPGITGWAQVNGFHGPTNDYDSVIIRYYWDAMYIRKAGIWLDIKILLKTFAKGTSNLVAPVLNVFKRSSDSVVVIDK